MRGFMIKMASPITFLAIAVVFSGCVGAELVEKTDVSILEAGAEQDTADASAAKPDTTEIDEASKTTELVAMTQMNSDAAAAAAAWCPTGGSKWIDLAYGRGRAHAQCNGRNVHVRASCEDGSIVNSSPWWRSGYNKAECPVGVSVSLNEAWTQ